MTVPGRVESASTAIHIDIAGRLQACPGMSVRTHSADRQLIGETVIDPDAESAGRKVVSVRVVIAINVYKVAKACHPDSPAILRHRLHRCFHRALRALTVNR